MTDESMAECKRRRLEPKRADQLEAMRERLVELGDHEGLDQLNDSMSNWQLDESAARYGSPAKAMVETVTEEIKASMRDLGAPPERVNTVHVSSTLQNDVSAKMTSFSDGSGLVEISDAVLTLSGQYSQFSADGLTRIGAGGAIRGRIAAFRAAVKGSMAGDPAVLTGLLRYYNVNQRVYGLSAKLGLRTAPAAMETAALIQLQATNFVIGHEIAHHVLGHVSPVSAFSPGEHVPVCTGNQRLELDADLLAYRATVRTLEREFAGTPAISAIAFNAMLGALVAMLAIHATEEALFIRRGVSHPPARTRAALLLEQLSSQEQQVARLFLTTLLSATESASAFDESARVFDWQWVAATPALASSQPVEYLRRIAELDVLQCRSAGALVEVLESLERMTGVRVADGAHLAAGGRAAAALRSWSLAEDMADALCDPHRALLFHTLVSRLRHGFTGLGMDRSSALTAAVTAAQLAGSVPAMSGRP